jgi:hypothetical protein
MVGELMFDMVKAHKFGLIEGKSVWISEKPDSQKIITFEYIQVVIPFDTNLIFFCTN